MKRFTIPRRTILRGVGGATLALPALEIMGLGSRQAVAAGGIKRFLHAYCGTSIAGCYRVQDHPNGFDYVTPKGLGQSYEITMGLKSIMDHGVKSDMGLVSGLRIPTVAKKGPHNVPGGKPWGFHTTSMGPTISGVSSFGSWGFSERQMPLTGPSCDQLIVDRISKPDQFMKTLPLLLAPSYGNLTMKNSWSAPIAGNQVDPWGRPAGKPIEPYLDPETLYRKLFGQGVPGSTTDSSTAREDQWRTRRSVVDAVRERMQALMKRCSQSDCVQLTRYSDQIRDLERQIDQLKTQSTGTVPPAPPHIPVGTVFAKDPDTRKEIYDTTAGWSNEALRGKIQAELVHAAFISDLTRVVTWQVGLVNLYPAFGVKMDSHTATHHNNGQPTIMARTINWNIGLMAYLVKLLGDTKDIDGSRMIDNTALCMYFEGGGGHSDDAPTKDGNVDITPEYLAQGYLAGSRWAHSVENMIVVTAGGKNLGLHLNQHVALNNTRHPAEVILTLMRGLGHSGPLGEMTETIPELTRG